jgi:hypothetical protein
MDAAVLADVDRFGDGLVHAMGFVANVGGVAGAMGFQDATERAQLVARAEAARRVECHSSQQICGRVRHGTATTNQKTMTARTISPRIMAAKPSLISSNRMRRVISSSSLSLPER